MNINGNNFYTALYNYILNAYDQEVNDFHRKKISQHSKRAGFIV